MYDNEVGEKCPTKDRAKSGAFFGKISTMLEKCKAHLKRLYILGLKTL